jgi:hypothetical protein
MPDEFDLTHTTADQLDSLFALTAAQPHPWTDQDLAALFLHQLSAPLSHDLRINPADLPPNIRSFGDLLSHPTPPLDLLNRAKDFAKRSDSRPDAPLPPELATTLYYATLAAAFVRLNQRISALPPEQLHAGFQWAQSQPWLPPHIHTLFQSALNATAEFAENAEGRREKK